MTGPVGRPVSQIFDVIISRPNILFGAAGKLPRNVLQRARIFEALATSGKREITEAARMEQFLLPHGNVVTGGMVFPDLQKHLKITPLIVEGVDQTPRALREQTGAIRMDWGQTDALKLELPRRVTDEQVKHLSRYFDNNQLDTVQVISYDGKVVNLNRPIGAQVEDAVWEQTGRYAKRESRLTPELMKQFAETGVFKGQAGLLDDGTPVEIRMKKGDKVHIFDYTMNKEAIVDESKLQILPTTLDDQFKPNNIFTKFLDPEERLAIGRMRLSLASNLGRPIKKFHELEKFAGSQGFIAERLTQGRVGLVDMASGERQTFDTIGAATLNLRHNVKPGPDLTPDVLKGLFGEDTANVGWINGAGQPPKFGELIPIPKNIVHDVREMQDKLPGAVEYLIKPMRGMFQSLQARTGLPFGDLFLNIHQQTVLRQNFNARWIHGKGVALPNKVQPLDRIRKLAGKDADEELITEWLESGGDQLVRARVEGQMSAKELTAAQELRKWYDELFKELQVQADYLENYAPHWRMSAQKYGNDIYDIWRATRRDPLPKAATFYADYYRTGLIDIYDTQAFRIASKYAHAGSSKRYMSEVLDQASHFLRKVPDRAMVKPMSEYLEAIRGFEFLEQKQMIERTLESMFNKLPGLGETASKGLADKLSDLAIGMGYMSSLAYRFPAVLRNYTQIMHTTYAIFGSANGAFVEGIGRAMTKAGKLQAVQDGAVSYKSASVFGRQEIDESLPFLKKFSDAGFKMYDNADEFTRAATYWVARENAMRAIARYAKKADGANPARSKRALDDLLTEAKVYTFEKNIQTEFIRRMTNNPESAARFIGKQMSDVTQFLYGRGMQPYWMRSVWGKFLGQYGTWSLWYVDYVTRTTRNLMRNGHHGEAMKFLGRNALVNLAIVTAGHEVLEVDLSRWLSYPSIFYSGGPGAQVAVGMMNLFRGLAEVASGSESEFAQSYVTQGTQILGRAGLSYIPFRSAARDVQRLVKAAELNQQGSGYTPLLAVMLGTKPTKDWTIADQLDALFPGGPLAYEEWMRYDKDGNPNPAVMSESAKSEIDWYRTLNAPPGQAAARSPETTPPLQRAPTNEMMGVPPPMKVTGPSRSTLEIRKQGGVQFPAESEPLQR